MRILQEKQESFHNYEFTFKDKAESNNISIALEHAKRQGYIKDISTPLWCSVNGENGSIWACVRDDAISALCERLGVKDIVVMDKA